MKHRRGNWRRGLFLAGVLALTGVLLWMRQLTSPAIPPSGTAFVIHQVGPPAVRYIAVGDCYTCGTGVTPEQAWPSLLTADLRARGVPTGLVANVAVDGWRTEDALTQGLPSYQAASPTFATLMIGVNDTYEDLTLDQFRQQLGTLMDKMQTALPDPSHLVILTIPDFAVTPVGARYAWQNDAWRRIFQFNTIIQEEAQKRHLTTVDLFPLSKQMRKAPH